MVRGPAAERTTSASIGAYPSAEGRLFSAAGNRFVVLDAFECLPEDAAALARESCVRHGVDGLLLGARPEAGGDCRMVVYNRDGSRAEACGNGLRALARWAVENGRAQDELVIETDAGPRRVVCMRRGEEIIGARTELGVPRVVAPWIELDLGERRLRPALVDMGNPHCVLLVEDIERAEVGTLGPLVERHERFPLRTNVSFVQIASGGLRVRTWERGVGETSACGTGVAACAVAGMIHGHVRTPVEIQTRGGSMQVDWDGTGVLTLAGPVDTLGSCPSQ